jgi:hypothetical protein
MMSGCEAMRPEGKCKWDDRFSLGAAANLRASVIDALRDKTRLKPEDERSLQWPLKKNRSGHSAPLRDRKLGRNLTRGHAMLT